MIALDVETTGMSPTHCSIVSLGALDTDNPHNQFYEECGVSPEAHIYDEALAVHGFSREELLRGEKQSESTLIQNFFAWALEVEDRTIIAQNPSFDHDFIRLAGERAHLEFPFAKRTLDIHSLVWLHMEKAGVEQPVSRHHSLINLDFALRYCGIPEEPRPHNALTGALSHAEVFFRIAYNQKTLPEFLAYDIPWMTNH